MCNNFEARKKAPLDREILPDNVFPECYQLRLEPDLEKFTFNGDVTIDLTMRGPQDGTITLNTLELTILEASLDGEKAIKFESDEHLQRTTFYFDASKMDQKTAKLNIKFSGILNDGMSGFYRAKYKDAISGETKYMATTQFEPTDARRAFPCFDEPNLKSRFEVTLISEPQYTHLSNMNVAEEVTKDGKKITTFSTTPLMSTYLVAFIVAELKYIENNDFRVPIRVYATPGNEINGKYAAEVSARTLKFFEDKFGIEYPFPKLDNVAIPEFSAGAMENWGLVTYRVVDLLLDRENATLGRIQRVAEVVQHELAHQWFGNLVTMDWWEGLWLNEGFATWMSWYSCNHFEPEWHVWEQYVPDNLQSALSLDSLRSSHPIEVPVQRADEINQIFDAISYCKGASVLRMISIWLGEDVFIKGVSAYLNEFKFKNATTVDLWDSLSKVSGKDVRTVMDTWAKKVGFPVVIVDEKEGGKVTFTQHRYLSTGDVKPEEDTTIYPVFLELRDKDGVNSDLILDDRSVTVELKDPEFFKVNANQVGLYITSYTDERWKKLASQAHLLSVEDRTGLVADCKSLASSGYTSATNLLSLVSQWKDEESFVVWDQMLASIKVLKSTWLFEDQKTIDALNDYIRQLVSPKVKQLGWSINADDSFAVKHLKVEMFTAACAAGDPETTQAACDMFDRYIAGEKTAIAPVLRPAVFLAVAKKGSVEYYDKMLEIFKNGETTDERLTALSSLGRFKDHELMKRTLGYLLDGTVLNQDIYQPIGGLRSHREGSEMLWVWLKENWGEVHKRLSAAMSMLGSVVNLCSSGFTSLSMKDEVSQFFETKSTKGFDRSLAQSLDIITTKAQWVARDREAVKAYLKENGHYK